MTIDLGQWLAGQAFAFMLIFCRMGSACMLFPGLGEGFVLPRLRLLFALALSFLLLAPLGSFMPPPPATAAETVQLVVNEVVIGIFFGMILRMLLGALETAGTMISYQIGLSNATLFNPAFATQGTLSGAILSTSAIVVLFASGMDNMLFRALVGTYQLLPPTQPLIYDDVGQQILKTVSRSFQLGAELAAPFIIIGVVMSVVFGVMAKLMPQMQVFAVALPLQIMAGLALFGITASGILMAWMGQLDDALRGLNLL